MLDQNGAGTGAPVKDNAQVPLEGQLTEEEEPKEGCQGEGLTIHRLLCLCHPLQEDTTYSNYPAETEVNTCFSIRVCVCVCVVPPLFSWQLF